MNKYLDYDGLIFLWNKLKNMFANKVDKQNGKDLSSNDFTGEYKAILDKWGESGGYVLPAATDSILGGVKVGERLSITEEGVLSAEEPDLSDYVRKNDLVNVYRYKGSKDDFSSLPPEEENTIGDVWNVTATDMNYAWDGEKWDPLGQMFEITKISNEEINSIMGTE